MYASNFFLLKKNHKTLLHIEDLSFFFLNKCKFWNGKFRQAAGGETNEEAQSLFLRLHLKRKEKERKEGKKGRREGIGF